MVKSLYAYIQKLLLINMLILFLLVSAGSRLYSQTATGLNFDGVDDKCAIPDNAAYNLGTGNFTFEAWVKASAAQTNFSPSIFYRRNGSGLSIFLDQIGRVSFYLGGSTTTFSAADIDDNICHHIALIRSSQSAITLYVDGVIKGTSTGLNYGSINTNAGITIGYSGAFKGWIHEVRFWNVARTQTEIQNSKSGFLFGNETGLIGYWRMNEGSGQIINDLSLTNNDGILGNVNTVDASDPQFVANSCMCPNPVISSSGGAVCVGQTPTLSTLLVTGFTYQWKLNGANIAGATSSTYTATAAGNYTCLATAFGCSGTSNIITIISGAPPATISAGGPTTFCSPPGFVMLSANTGTNLSYQWKLNGVNIGAATNSTYLATSTGIYTCAVTNNCGTSISNSISVTANPSPFASITAGGATTFCVGSNVLLTAFAVSGYAYQWKLNGINIGGAASSTYTATASGSYTVQVTLGSCTAVSSAISVVVHQPLNPVITESLFTFCSSSPVNLQQNVQGSGFTYQWFEDNHAIPGAVGVNYETIHNGNFGNTVTNACGTFFSVPYNLNDPFLANFPRAIISANGPLTICSGTSVLLQVDQNFNYFNFQWYKDGVAIPGANSDNYSATQAGSYCCSMIDNFGCTFFSNWLTLTTSSLPSATITTAGSTTFCSGGSVLLKAPVNANRSYQWQKGGVNIAGAVASSFTATTGGSYKVTVTNTVTGCSKTTPNATVVTINPLPTATITPQGPTTFCAGGNVVLKANSGTGLAYQWKKGGTNIAGATQLNYTATTAGVYKVKVTNSNGCSKLSAGVTVTVPCKESGEFISSTDFNVSVYPNPSSGDFIFEFENPETEKISINVYDMVGKLILSESIQQSTFIIEQSKLKPGIYIAVINNGIEIKTLKIVKDTN